MRREEGPELIPAGHCILAPFLLGQDHLWLYGVFCQSGRTPARIGIFVWIPNLEHRCEIERNTIQHDFVQTEATFTRQHAVMAASEPSSISRYIPQITHFQTISNVLSCLKEKHENSTNLAICKQPFEHGMLYWIAAIKKQISENKHHIINIDYFLS